MTFNCSQPLVLVFLRISKRMNSVPCGIKKSYKKNGGRKTESRPRGKHSRRRCWGLLGWSKFRANYQTVQATRKKEEFDRVLK